MEIEVGSNILGLLPGHWITNTTIVRREPLTVHRPQPPRPHHQKPPPRRKSHCFCRRHSTPHGLGCLHPRLFGPALCPRDPEAGAAAESGPTVPPRRPITVSSIKGIPSTQALPSMGRPETRVLGTTQCVSCKPWVCLRWTHRRPRLCAPPGVEARAYPASLRSQECGVDFTGPIVVHQRSVSTSGRPLVSNGPPHPSILDSRNTRYHVARRVQSTLSAKEPPTPRTNWKTKLNSTVTYPGHSTETLQFAWEAHGSGRVPARPARVGGGGAGGDAGDHRCPRCGDQGPRYACHGRAQTGVPMGIELVTSVSSVAAELSPDVYVKVEWQAIAIGCPHMGSGNLSPLPPSGGWSFASESYLTPTRMWPH